MKHTFVKKALLLGAFSMFISNFSIYAMDAAGAPMDPAVQQEVQTKTGFFAGWSTDALRKKLDNAMEELDKLWKCVKSVKSKTTGQEELKCTPGQVRAIVGTLTTILAIVAALTLTYGYKKDRPWLGAPGRLIGRGLTAAGARVSPYAESFSEKFTTTAAPYRERLQPYTARLQERWSTMEQRLPGYSADTSMTTAPVKK